MGRTTWKRVAGVVVVALVVAFGCKFEPGKKVTWTSTIDTQFSIGDGEDRAIGYYHFNDAFEVNPGSVSLKLGYRANQTEGPSTPTNLTWRFSVYDSTFATMKFQYDLPVTGKMKQKGCCAYNVSFKGNADFPGWNVDAGDNLQWSVLPQGGFLPSGIALGIKYAYTPH
jgi:hypothetical protein